jgi:adenosine kinase
MNIAFIYDPSQQIARLTGPNLKKGASQSKILILNDYELEMFKKKTNLSDDDLHEITETLVVTRGEEGSSIKTNEECFEIPIASPNRVVDPTGVGDAYRAGLMKGMAHGMPLEVAGRMGSLAATYVIETDGPQNHTFTLKDFVHRYKQAFGHSDEIMTLLPD